MEETEYKELQQQYDELQASSEALENKIYACRDEAALVLLRADFRELAEAKENIFNTLIAAKS